MIGVVFICFIVFLFFVYRCKKRENIIYSNIEMGVVNVLAEETPL